MVSYSNDIVLLKDILQKLPKYWDGKECVLELKAANYNWKQMEWWAFYLEYKAKALLKDDFRSPGDRFHNVAFDLRGQINWDLKASAIKTDNHRIILNDKIAMDHSIEKDGFHGEIIALCDVVYNDADRSFQKWHTELKGGKSNYEKEREVRTSVSRYRKTKAELTEIILLVLKKENLEELPIMKQGRNSNGTPRKVKYMLDLETIDNYETHIIKF
jgi:hypothetical protein